MAGHSHWNNIHRTKGVADAKRAKVFSKLSRYIMVAAKSGGGDPDSNLRLRYAIDTFDCLHDEGASAPRMMSLGLHLRIIGRPGRIGAFKRFLAHVAGKPGVWVATRLQIAEHFKRVAPRAR